MNRLLSIVGLAVLAHAGIAQERRPNIVFVLVDDLGYRDVGFTGSRFYETPRIDALAKQGMVFTNAYANAPNCAPSRACLMSGQYTPRHGIYTVGSSARGKSRFRKLIPTKNKTVLADGIVTMTEALKQAGYATCHAGKWHLGRDPRSQGFDVNVGGNQAGHPKSYFSPYRNPDLPDGPKGEYLTDRITRDALRFVEEHKAGPFFLWMSYYAVHTPIQPKRAKVGKYADKEPDGGQKNARYAAMVETMDDNVGRILDRLDELGIANDTVVVFFSDNGGNGRVTSNAPLRGAKGMLYEGGIREPLIVRWPGKVEAASRSDEPVIGVDFFPTFVEVAGAKLPDQKLDGLSLLPLLEGKADTLGRDALYWHFPAYLQANARRGTWRTTPAGAIRAGDFKLIEFFEDGRLELYDLAKDPGESSDLSETLPAKTKELTAQLAAWRESLDAPVPKERNPEFGRR